MALTRFKTASGMNYCATKKYMVRVDEIKEEEFQNRKRYELLRNPIGTLTEVRSLNIMFQNRKRYELLRNTILMVTSRKLTRSFKTASGMNYCATENEVAKAVEEMTFQNRKRYELLRNSIYQEINSYAHSKFVLENDLIFESKRRKNPKTLSQKFQKILTDLYLTRNSNFGKRFC